MHARKTVGSHMILWDKTWMVKIFLLQLLIIIEMSHYFLFLKYMPLFPPDFSSKQMSEMIIDLS